MKNTKQDSPEPNFEQALVQLETLVGEMEGGRLSLDESLKKFSDGMALAEFCATKLSQAEKSVEILLKKSETSPVWGEFILPDREGAREEPESSS